MINPITLKPQNKDNDAKCPDCYLELYVPRNIEKGEILSCPGCGLELEVKKTAEEGECLELQELALEGEDWGE
jgi:hypothetical protein